MPDIKKELWVGEFWTDWYYFTTVSGRGDKKVIEKYIEGQGRAEDIIGTSGEPFGSIDRTTPMVFQAVFAFT